MKTQSIYFISYARGPIKIGIAKNVNSRLSALQTGHAYPLEILGTMPGAGATEKNLHARFSKWRLRGEWFERNDELLAFIKSNCAKEVTKKAETNFDDIFVRESVREDDSAGGPVIVDDECEEFHGKVGYWDDDHLEMCDVCDDLSQEEFEEFCDKDERHPDCFCQNYAIVYFGRFESGYELIPRESLRWINGDVERDLSRKILLNMFPNLSKDQHDRILDTGDMLAPHYDKQVWLRDCRLVLEKHFKLDTQGQVHE